MMRWLGLDIGGANLKAADQGDSAKHLPFPLWRNPDRLHEELHRLIIDMPPFDAVALTMTGEMADCFETREEGVCRILEQVTRVIPAGSVKVYGVDGQWRSVSQAARSAWQVAASNWKALAEYAVRWTKNEPTLLIDIGSTTTDILAIENNHVRGDSRTDHDRLLSGELVYTGTERSSVVGLLQQVIVHDRPCPIINEQFATTGDVNLILGLADEFPEDRDTTDGRPKTRAAAAFRLARIVGEDGTTLGSTDIESIAEEIYEAQVGKIGSAVQKVIGLLAGGRCSTVLSSGHGEHLVDNLVDRLGWNVKRIKLSQQLGPSLSRCAPAHAVAVLASEAFRISG
jgi:probable H4MPT-linked C1 transfer pathway protein